EDNRACADKYAASNPYRASIRRAVSRPAPFATRDVKIVIKHHRASAKNSLLSDFNQRTGAQNGAAQSCSRPQQQLDARHEGTQDRGLGKPQRIGPHSARNGNSIPDNQPRPFADADERTSLKLNAAVEFNAL